MNTNEYFAQEKARQAAQQQAYTDLCRLLEHAPDRLLLSDYTAQLVWTLSTDRQEEALKMIRGQLYSRELRSAGRVESWFEDCTARIREDPEGFVRKAEQEYGDAVLDEEQHRMHTEKTAKRRKKPRVRPACEFAPEAAEYLVEPYLPRGMITILGGVSGSGKTSLALDICARISRGGPFQAKPSPSGEGGCDQREQTDEGKLCDSALLQQHETAATPHPLRCAQHLPPRGKASGRPVLYLTAENDPNKVLRPRAEAMGADLTRLYFQDGASYAMGDEELAALCRSLHPALIVFDPIQSYLGQGVQMNRAEQVRPLLDALGALAKELDMAVVLISHMSKPGPGVSSALDRLLGSSDFRNAARSILIVGRDPDHPDTRVVAHAKNSLGVPGESQQYHICENGTVAYDGPCSLTADRIIRETGEGQPRTRPAAALGTAVEVLDRQLSFVGWVEHAEVERLCARHGFSERTMRRAREALGLKVQRAGKPPEQKCLWYRAELSRDAVLADYYNQHEPLNMADLQKTSADKLGRTC